MFEDHNGDIIEDWFTPRVCLAPTMDDAITALSLEGTYYDAYATVTDLALELPYTGGPSTPEMPYGPYFVMSDWLDYLDDEGIEVTDDYVQDAFDGCVPDAADTGEKWSLVPVRVTYLGVYNAKTKQTDPPLETSTRRVARKLAAFLAR